MKIHKSYNNIMPVLQQIVCFFNYTFMLFADEPTTNTNLYAKVPTKVYDIYGIDHTQEYNKT